MTLQRFAFLLPALAATLVFAPTIGFDLTNWDDTAYVSANSLIRDLSPAGLLKIFDPRSHVVYDWTPLVTLSYAAEVRLAGDVLPGLHHATNVGLHAITAGLIVGLLRRMGFGLAVAVAGALLFAVHPLQVESVAWVSGRKTILSTLFGVLCARIYMDARTNRDYGLAVVLFGAALLSKATLVALPVFLAASDQMRGRLRAAAPWLVGLFALALVRAAVSVWAQDDVVDDARFRGIVGRLAVLGPVVLTYARQLFLPVDLSAHYSWPELGWSDPQVLLSWGIIGAGAALLVRAATRSTPVAHASWWALAALLPVLNLLPAPHLQADRYLYTALASVGGLVALPVLHAGGGRGARGLLAGATLAVAVGLLCAVTLQRNRVWVGSVALWSDTVARDPGFAVAHGNLGSALLVERRLDESEASLRRALELEPRLTEARLALVSLLRLRGARDEAARELARVREAEPENPGALVLAGEMAEFRADSEGARELYAEAIRYNPSAVRALERLGVLEAERGDRDAALSFIAEARRLRPNRRGLAVTVAWIHLRLGDTEEAETTLVGLATSDPTWAEPAYVLGLARIEGSDRDGALRAFDTALERDPRHGRARLQRAELRLESGDRSGAEKDFRAALSVTPGRPRIVLPLVELLVGEGRTPDAAHVLRRATSVRQSPDLLGRLAILTKPDDPAGARVQARRALALLPPDARPRWRAEVEAIAR